MAVESAGIVLVRSDPRDVVGAITLSRATYRKVAANAQLLRRVRLGHGAARPVGLDGVLRRG